MAHNWKILDGVNYIAKTGAPGAAGTLEAPKTLVAGAFVLGKNVIGTGAYTWPAGFALPAGMSIVADGHVRILSADNSAQQIFSIESPNIQGIYFEQWYGIVLSGKANINATILNCTFDLISQTYNNFITTPFGNGNFYYGACRFINCYSDSVSIASASARFTHSIFENSQMLMSQHSFPTSHVNNYFDPTSGFEVNTDANFINCNIDPLTVIGTNRGIKVGAGAWSNGQGYVGAVNCITQAPQFNNPVKGDFTLKPTSPHVALNIGPNWLGLAASYSFASTAGAGAVTTANTTVASVAGLTFPILSITGAGFTFDSFGALVIKPVVGGGVSTLTTGAMVLRTDARAQLTSIGFLGGLNMDTDFALVDPTVPRPQNTNVPDYTNGTAATATRKPNRLSWRIRWSDLANPDVNNITHWTTGTTWVEVELFALPTYNLATSLGNADVDFVPVNALPILCRNWQLEIVMRDNYGV